MIIRYALRANAAVKWILEHETMPPTPFLNVIDGITMDDATRKEIADLIDKKSKANEKDRVIPSPLFGDLLFDRFEELRNVVWRTRLNHRDELQKEMCRLFRCYAKGVL